MTKIINLDDVQRGTKEFYEMCSDVSILQRELDQMLVAIEKNSKDYSRGRISKDLFKYNEKKMKKECARIIKGINSSIDKSNSIILKMNKEIISQKINERKGRKSSSLAEIKKNMTAQSPSVEQKTQKGK